MPFPRPASVLTALLAALAASAVVPFLAHAALVGPTGIVTSNTDLSWALDGTGFFPSSAPSSEWATVRVEGPDGGTYSELRCVDLPTNYGTSAGDTLDDGRYVHYVQPANQQLWNTLAGGFSTPPDRCTSPWIDSPRHTVTWIDTAAPSASVTTASAYRNAIVVAGEATDATAGFGQHTATPPFTSSDDTGHRLRWTIQSPADATATRCRSGATYPIAAFPGSANCIGAWWEADAVGPQTCAPDATDAATSLSTWWCHARSSAVFLVDRPGDYAITLTATDQAGHTTTATRAVTVTAWEAVTDPTPTKPTQSTPTTSTPLPSLARVVAVTRANAIRTATALRRLGRTRLLRRGSVTVPQVQALLPGTARIVVSARFDRRNVVVGSVGVRFRAASSGTYRIPLNAAGKRLARRGPLVLTITSTFTALKRTTKGIARVALR